MITTIAAIRSALSGWKTYITVALWFVCLGLELGLGIDVAGFEPGTDWLETSFNMILVATGRSALGKITSSGVVEGLLSRIGK